jgi:hypothetical protein
MTDDPRDDMDKLSDLLKSSTLRTIVRGYQLPEFEIAALFVNERDGPQFFTGERGRAQPLYSTPAREGQEPVAWRQIDGRMITQDRSMYREDIQWAPLYLAR